VCVCDTMQVIHVSLGQDDRTHLDYHNVLRFVTIDHLIPRVS
jgi:hypothetical protein